MGENVCDGGEKERRKRRDQNTEAPLYMGWTRVPRHGEALPFSASDGTSVFTPRWCEYGPESPRAAVTVLSARQGSLADRSEAVRARWVVIFTAP